MAKSGGVPEWVWAAGVGIAAYFAWKWGWLDLSKFTLTPATAGTGAGALGAGAAARLAALPSPTPGSYVTLPATGGVGVVQPDGTVEPVTEHPPFLAPAPAISLLPPAAVDVSAAPGPAPNEPSATGSPLPASAQQVAAAREAGAYLPPLSSPEQYYAPVATETGGVTIGVVNPPPSPLAVAVQNARNIEILSSVPANTVIPATAAGVVIDGVRFSSSKPITAAQMAGQLAQVERRRTQRLAKEAEIQKTYGVSTQEFKRRLGKSLAGLRKLRKRQGA